MTTSSQTEPILRVLDLVSHLGGPSCTTDDLQWAVDIPAGKQLLEWLASQNPDEDFSHVAGVNHSQQDGDARRLQTVLSPIALYTDESATLARLESRSKGGEHRDTPTTPVAYALPAQIKARAEAAEAEADLLEKQTARLKHRLNASKAAGKELKQAIHTLKKQIQASDDTIREQQQRLADMSAQTDSAATQHTNLALRTLQEAIPISSQGTGGSDTLDDLKSEIAMFSGSRAAVASAVKQLYKRLDDGYAQLPSASELQRDASLVNARLKGATKGVDVDKLVDVAYIQELEKMTKRVEQGRGGEEEITRILTSMAHQPTSREEQINVDVDVKEELERAGRMDRTVLLKAQDKGLDSIINYMRVELIPRSKQTYDILQTRSTLTMEAEAMVSTLIEELEDVNDAVESTKRAPVHSNQDEEDPEELLEGEIMSLLKSMLGSGEGGSGKRTVLLNRTDVTAELSSLDQRLAASQKAEEKWAADLRGHLTELSMSTAPLLSAAYANSPVNTSPPFAPTVEHVSLYEATRAKATELTDAAARLQKETDMSSRDKRKLGTFAEKWAVGR